MPRRPPEAPTGRGADVAAEARLAALTNQLQPHFLFNALHSVSALLDEDPDAARRMLARLAELLRRVLDAGGRQEIDLRGELELVELYLAVERVRLGGRLRVAREIASETLNACVPYLVLQPLVENAVRHGVALQRSGGRVTITAERESDVLRLKVWNDLPAAGESGGGSVREGVGLQNTRRRLEVLYGSSQRVRTIREPDRFVIELEMPFRESAVPADPSASPS